MSNKTYTISLNNEVTCDIKLKKNENNLIINIPVITSLDNEYSLSGCFNYHNREDSCNGNGASYLINLLFKIFS